MRDVGLASAPDDVILGRALVDDRVIISHDTDFGTLLAARRQVKPSLVLVRSSDPMTADDIAGLILANVEGVAAELGTGAIVTFARGRLRVRRLPVG